MSSRVRPRKSLRTVLMLWFLLFSSVPLAFITGYSLVKYEQAIDLELSKRLVANGREISIILKEFESTLIGEVRNLASDKSVIFFLSTNNVARARDYLQNWMRGHFAHRVWLYNREGRLDAAVYRNPQGEIERKMNLESGDVFLNEEFLKMVSGDNSAKIEYYLVDLQSETPLHRTRKFEGRVDLVVFSRIKNSAGRVVGFVEAVIAMDESFLQSLKNRMNLELYFRVPDKEKVVSTNDDLSLLASDIERNLPSREDSDFFELTLREEPYRFMVHPLSWGDTKFELGLGASKSAARAVLKNVNTAFFSVVGAMGLLLVIMSLITSRLLLRPIYDILQAIESADFEKGVPHLPSAGDNELGLLVESFNDMAARTHRAQKALGDKVAELEAANIEIRETQARLLHTSKMASLGQLVAGIAHELNNPIGFIYSNMSHLKDYADKLIELVRLGSKDAKEMKSRSKEVDFDYIVKDMPKLIKSCEDGARRVRDIVVGLRNFSRLDEAQFKEVDLHESLDNTLNLISGELKNRIKVIKNYDTLPLITCYPSQLNQVFMNILTNAAQAIEGEGEIEVSTHHLGDRVEVRIRDSGKGMSKTTTERIFDPFFTTKTVGSGTGLGLSISYGVIEKHGGEIHVESEVGKGTTFIITLPIKPDVEIK